MFDKKWFLLFLTFAFIVNINVVKATETVMGDTDLTCYYSVSYVNESETIYKRARIGKKDDQYQVCWDNSISGSNTELKIGEPYGYCSEIMTYDELFSSNSSSPAKSGQSMSFEKITSSCPSFVFFPLNNTEVGPCFENSGFTTSSDTKCTDYDSSGEECNKISENSQCLKNSVYSGVDNDTSSFAGTQYKLIELKSGKGFMYSYGNPLVVRASKWTSSVDFSKYELLDYKTLKKDIVIYMLESGIISGYILNKNEADRITIENNKEEIVKAAEEDFQKLYDQCLANSSKTCDSVISFQPKKIADLFNEIIDEILSGEANQYIATYNNDCSLFGDVNDSNSVAYWIQLSLDIIKYAAIILLFVLTTMDLFKAFVSQDNDGIKKAYQTAIKRFIYAVIIFFLPILIEFLMDLFGAYGTCGFN